MLLFMYLVKLGGKKHALLSPSEPKIRKFPLKISFHVNMTSKTGS